MSTAKIFVHGVPDSPAIWQPLIAALNLDDQSPILTPALPGFETPPPTGFSATKDEYAEWLITQIEDVHQKHGVVDLIGHDWGALLVLRAACLRPELVRSWAVSNAVLDPDYRGHRLARLWNMPLIGELVMATGSADALAKALAAAGVPPAIAAKEARNWNNKHMRRSILRLYRSANGLRFKGPWLSDLERLPKKGLVFWGVNDPYVPLEVGKRFSARWQIPLEEIADTNHWAIAEQPDKIASILKRFW